MKKKDCLNKIIHGDCLEVMKGIPDGKIDMILADLPYGVTARNKWDEIISFELLWRQYERVIKENGAMVFTSIQPFTSLLIMSNPKLFKYEWIWKKSKITGVLNAKKMPVRNHEQILVFYKKLPQYNPQGLKEFNQYIRQGTSSKNYKQREENNTYFQKYTNYPRSILEIKSAGKTVHPTQKPVKLLEYLIKTYTNEGDIVLDNVIGSGTTAIACINTNRNFIGIELDEKYVKIARDRISGA